MSPISKTAFFNDEYKANKPKKLFLDDHLTAYEERVIVQYIEARLQNKPINLGELPPWLSELEIIRQKWIEHKDKKSNRVRHIFFVGKWVTIKHHMLREIIPTVGDIIDGDLCYENWRDFVSQDLLWQDINKGNGKVGIQYRLINANIGDSKWRLAQNM